MTSTSDRQLRVAIVGAGPAGFYAAGHLLAAERPVGVWAWRTRGRGSRYGEAPTRADAQRACPSRAVRFIDWRGVLTHVDTTWFKGSLDVDRHVGAQRAKPRAAARR